MKISWSKVWKKVVWFLGLSTFEPCLTSFVAGILATLIYCDYQGLNFDHFHSDTDSTHVSDEGIAVSDSLTFYPVTTRGLTETSDEEIYESSSEDGWYTGNEMQKNVIVESAGHGAWRYINLINHDTMVFNVSTFGDNEYTGYHIFNGSNKRNFNVVIQPFEGKCSIFRNQLWYEFSIDEGKTSKVEGIKFVKYEGSPYEDDKKKLGSIIYGVEDDLTFIVLKSKDDE